MAAVRTDLVAADLPDDLHAMRSAIEEAVPVGFRAHDTPVNPRRLAAGGRGPTASTLTRGWQQFWAGFADLHPTVMNRRGRAEAQLGTLGGGNHFIEVCLDTDDQVWVMLHSGSRNIGKELAERHMSVARGLPHNRDLPDRDLAVFVAGTPQMQAYRRDLDWAQQYAWRNRELMLALVCRAVDDQFGSRTVGFDDPISCHHNYVAEEQVDLGDGTTRAMLVTRKGAIRAGAGDLGLIPGSMGTRSYVVRGLGNPASFNSASHGAGRRMSRGAAKRAFSVNDLVAATEGIECRKDAGVIDEIPAAYKDIDAVIEAQRDLVEVVATLRQVLCVKG
jgi:tRNA-splicing ligase RtcB